MAGTDEPAFIFQARHYEAIAKMLAGSKPEDDGERGLYIDKLSQWSHMVEIITKSLAMDRPSGFDIARFLRAVHRKDKH